MKKIFLDLLVIKLDDYNSCFFYKIWRTGTFCIKHLIGRVWSWNWWRILHKIKRSPFEMCLRLILLIPCSDLLKIVVLYVSVFWFMQAFFFSLMCSFKISLYFYLHPLRQSQILHKMGGLASYVAWIFFFTISTCLLADCKRVV